jgi:hypothetical protein
MLLRCRNANREEWCCWKMASDCDRVVSKKGTFYNTHWTVECPKKAKNPRTKSKSISRSSNPRSRDSGMPKSRGRSKFPGRGSTQFLMEMFIEIFLYQWESLNNPPPLEV